MGPVLPRMFSGWPENSANTMLATAPANTHSITPCNDNTRPVEIASINLFVYVIALVLCSQQQRQLNHRQFQSHRYLYRFQGKRDRFTDPQTENYTQTDSHTEGYTDRRKDRKLHTQEGPQR